MDLNNTIGKTGPAPAFFPALAAVLVYLPALRNGFVNWDDPKYVYDNPFIRSLDFGFLKWAFTSFHASNWHPVTWISHAVDYAVWGLNPLGHHLTSIIFHGLNTFLVVMLVSRLVALGRKEENESVAVVTGLITGLLFGLHPLHVESVAWVSERKDVLYAFFYLLSIVAYLKYASSVPHRASRMTHYGLSLALFALSLMSKPMAVTLPLVLLILDVYPLGRLRLREAFGSCRGVLIEKVPFFLLSAASSVVTIAAQDAGGVLASTEAVPVGSRIAVALHSLVFYLSRMIWPSGLYPFYPYPGNVSFTSPGYAAALAAVAGITAFCILIAGKRKLWAAAWAFYAVSLLPVLGIVQVGAQAAADRYTYLPGLGPFILVGLGVALLYERSASRGAGTTRARAIMAAGAVLVAGLLSVLTVRQAAVWKDSFALWNYELAGFPDSHTAYICRAIAYVEKGDYRLAVEDVSRAIELNPQEIKFYINRGSLYALSGQFDKAVEDFSRALSLDPAFATAYYNRGLAYRHAGKQDEAVKDFQAAARLGDRQAQDYLRGEGAPW